MERTETSVELVEATKPRNYTQVFAVLLVSLGCLASGMIFRLSTQIIPLVGDDRTTNGGDSVLQHGWIESCMPLGALVGSLLSAFPIHLVGRRSTLLYVYSPISVTGLICSTLPSIVYALYLGMFIEGVGVGIAMTAAPLYIVETVTRDNRGALGCIPQLMFSLGILVASAWPYKYRLWSRIAVLSIILLVMMLLWIIPESPRWLLLKKRPEETKRALKWLRGPRHDVDKEMEVIEGEVNFARKRVVGVGNFFSGAVVKPVLVSLFLMFFQQVSGLNAFQFYLFWIFRFSGINFQTISFLNLNPEHLFVIIVGGIQVFTTLIAVCAVDCIGRKALLISSSFGMTISLGGMGTFLFYLERGQGWVINWFPLVCFMVFIVSFSLGFSSIPWIYSAEILPHHIRVSTFCAVATFSWLCVFLVIKTLVLMINQLHPFGTFWFFTSVATLGFFFTIFFVPETKRKTIQEIQASFGGRISTHDEIKLNGESKV